MIRSSAASQFASASEARAVRCAQAMHFRVGRSGTARAGSYELLLQRAFAEAFRILRPGRFMSVVFGNSNGAIWGLVQRAMRDAGFKAAPVHVAILDKGQRSVKGLNSGSESVVTVDLILTVQKPDRHEAANDSRDFRSGDMQHLITKVISKLSADEAANPSHVYARILREAIKEHCILDHLHLGDVLVALRNARYVVDIKTGRLSATDLPVTADKPRRKRAAGGRR